MWFNPIVIGLLRSPLHGMISGSTLVFTLRGRKTGRSITLPANYTCLDDGTLLSTSFRHRTWWRNLRDGADVTVRVAGRERAAHAIAVEDPESVAAGLRTLLGKRPGWAKHYHVALDERGAPLKSDCERRARELVLIRTRLPE